MKNTSTTSLSLLPPIHLKITMPTLLLVVPTLLALCATFFPRLYVSGQISTEIRDQPLLKDRDQVAACCARDGVVDRSIDALDQCLRAESAAERANGGALSDVLLLTIASAPSSRDSTHAMSNIRNFSVYQSAILRAYALQHGYKHISIDTLTPIVPNIADYDAVEDQRWHKIKLMADILNNRTSLDHQAKPYTYIFWIDADAIVLDFGFSIHSLAEEQFPNADIVASSDIRMGFINSGLMVVRNTPWAATFLDRWWTGYDNGLDKNTTCDQDAFDLLYRRYSLSTSSLTHREEDIATKVRILKMDALNTFPPAMQHQQPHNQFLHLMGESTAMRAQVFGTAYRHICAAAVGQQPLPPQLGVDRQHIVGIAETVYTQETKALITRCEQPDSSYEDYDRLSQAAHHLCDIYELLAEDSSPTITRTKIEQTRKQLYELVKSKLRQLYKEFQQTEQAPKSFDIMNFMMLLKRAAEAGNDYFRVSSTESLKRVIAAEVFHILEELQAQLAEESKNVPMHMSALMHQNLGRLDHAEANKLLQDFNALNYRKGNDDSEALRKRSVLRDKILKRLVGAQSSFKESISLFEQIIERDGRHIEMMADSSAHREHTDSVQMLAATQCLHSILHHAPGTDSSQTEASIHTDVLYNVALVTWDKAISMARAATGSVQVGIGVQWETLAEVLHNAAVCLFEANNSNNNNSNKPVKSADKGSLSAALDYVEESVRIREDIESRTAIPASSSPAAVVNSNNIELLGFSRKLKDTINQKMSNSGSSSDVTQHKESVYAQSSIKQRGTNILLDTKPQPGRILLVVPQASADKAVDGTDPMLMDEDEWEECDDISDSECVTFEVQGEVVSPPASDAHTHAKVQTQLPTTTPAVISSADARVGSVTAKSQSTAEELPGEIDPAELAEIQARYKSMSSRYVRQGGDATNDGRTSVPESKPVTTTHTEKSQQIPTRTDTPATSGKPTSDFKRAPVELPEEHPSKYQGDDDNENVAVLQDRVEKLEEIVLMLTERIRLLEKKNR
jgi:hypothetical protein